MAYSWFKKDNFANFYVHIKFPIIYFNAMLIKVYNLIVTQCKNQLGRFMIREFSNYFMLFQSYLIAMLDTINLLYQLPVKNNYITSSKLHELNEQLLPRVLSAIKMSKTSRNPFQFKSLPIITKWPPLSAVFYLLASS